MRTAAMDKRTLLLVTAGLGVFRGGPAECAAQTRADSVPEMLSLGAAIEEARRSPFHAGAADPRWKSSMSGNRAAGTRAPERSRCATQQEFQGNAGTRAAIPLILAAGWVSHWAAAEMGGACLEQRHHPGCFLWALLPMPAVAAPAALAGSDMQRTLAASAGGLAMGASIFLLAWLAGADHVPVLTLATGLVHAVLVVDGVR